MKYILLLLFFCALTVSAQLSPEDQAIADQQALDKRNEAQNLITKQRMEALQRQRELELQTASQTLQSQQAMAAGAMNSPPNQNPQQGSNDGPQSPPEAGNPTAPQSENQKNDQGTIKIPAGPVKAGPYTQHSIGTNNSRDLEQKIAGRVKDPFMLPNHLYMKIKRKLGDIQGEGYIDESVEPQRRWALKRYKLVAIIWAVKRPKAMITDAKQDMHMFYVNDKIGNSEGVITAISNGEITVNEKGTESKLKMIK